MLCYESFINAGIEGKYYFICEDGEYPIINNFYSNIEIIKHKEVANFGGKDGVIELLTNCLNEIIVDENDLIIISDADILVRENFLKHFKDFAHGGKGNIVNGLRHISGQMMILNSEIFKRLQSLTIKDIFDIVFEMLEKKYNIADDTFFSYLSDKWNFKKIIFPNSDEFWIHKKLYVETEKCKTSEDIKNISIK